MRRRLLTISLVVIGTTLLAVLLFVMPSDDSPEIDKVDIIGAWNCESGEPLAISDGSNLVLNADGTYSEALYAAGAACPAYDQSPDAGGQNCAFSRGIYSLDGNKLTLNQKERYTYVTKEDLALINPIRVAKYIEPLRLGWERDETNGDYLRLQITKVNNDFLHFWQEEYRIGNKTEKNRFKKDGLGTTCYRIRREGMFSVAPTVEEIKGTYKYAKNGFSGEMTVSTENTDASPNDQVFRIRLKTSARNYERNCVLDGKEIASERISGKTRKTGKAAVRAEFTGYDKVHTNSTSEIGFAVVFVTREAVIYVEKEKAHACGEDGWFAGKWRKNDLPLRDSIDARTGNTGKETGDKKKQVGSTIELPAISRSPNQEDVARLETERKAFLKEERTVELEGFIDFGHDPAGGRWDLVVNGSQEQRYTLRYVWQLKGKDGRSENDLLQRMADDKELVSVKGQLLIWKDGTSSFDEGAPLTISTKQQK